MAFSLEDSIGLNDLTNVNSVVGDTGQTGLAARFNGSNYLYIDDNVDLNINDESFFVEFYLKTSDSSGYQCVISKWGYGPAVNRPFAIHFGVQAANCLDFRVTDAGGWDVAVTSSVNWSSGGLHGSWQYVKAGYNKGSQEIYITVNATTDTASYTDTIGDGGYQFRIGVDQGSTYVVNGTLVDEVTYNKNGTDIAKWSFGLNDGSPAVSLSSSTTSISELGGTAAIIANMDATASETVNVVISIAGTATRFSDYNLSSGTISITSGQTSGSIAITTINDSSYEGDETFTASISSLSGGGATKSATSKSSLVITDDDDLLVRLTKSTTSLAENGGTASVIAWMGSTHSATVNVVLGFGGTGTLNTDYSVSAQTISITSGQSSASVTIGAIQDAIYEGNESPVVSISSISGGSYSASSISAATFTITDDDSQPSVTITSSAASFSENGGTVVVSALLSNPSTQNVTVNFLFGGSATLNTDYSASSNSLVITAGQTSGSITLSSINDSTWENNESVTVDVSSVTNGTENGTQQLTITLTEDDPTPGVHIVFLTSPVGEGSANVLRALTVPVFSTYSQNITVNFEVAGGTAIEGVDYTISTTSLTILSGHTDATGLVVHRLEDSISEPTETVIIRVTSVINGEIITAGSSASTTIVDNDAPLVTLTSSTSSITENLGTAIVRVLLDRTWSANTTVVLAFTGSATLNTDYSASTNTIVVASGQTSGSISVTAISDSAVEGLETIVVDISSVTEGTESGSQQITILLTDDDSQGSGCSGLSGVSGISGVC